MDEDFVPEETQHPAPSTQHYIRRALRLRCPVCGEGKMFVGMTMHEACPACGFPFEREPGYWTNAVTLNFMTMGGLVVIALGLALSVIFPLLAFRHIKALWLAIDLCIRPPTTFERLSGFLHVTRRSQP